MTNDPDAETLEAVLERARSMLGSAEQAMRECPPSLTDLHTAVDGAVRVTTGLAEFVAAIMHHVPATLERYQHTHALHDMLNDLHGVHDCLTTAPRLAEPARKDLRQLLATADPTPAKAPHAAEEGGAEGPREWF